ncbi:UDP-N-acetylmuramoyl-L-alanine--D-glutamate ligase [Magnetococcus sp. PR-3]|uniref:UDP-N-acetylmuramoyl-L-alanine--D-glutamate ligase n=1 Tax=Magnetococcus sp. PR-3 TaxID=3120355 RepID=UPI002FCE3433
MSALPSRCVIGLGGSGMATVAFLARQNLAILAWDEGAAAGRDAILAEQPQVTSRFEPLHGPTLAQCKEIYLSPGVPRAHPAIQEAIQAGVPVINDIELLFRQSEHAEFVGITGTNGKSTVTTLVGLMLDRLAGLTRTGGNLGQAALSLWAPSVERYVLELSSFQLESIEGFQPRVAALLNLSDDHLDRYDGLQGYLRAKARIFQRQTQRDRAVINADDPALDPIRDILGHPSAPRVIPFSVKKAVAGGVYVHDGQLWDHRQMTEAPQPIIALEEMRIYGRCNHANAAAAAAIALEAGACHEDIRHVLTQFPGLEHRMAWVRELDGIAYINDSKGTNVGAVMEALASFPGGVVLIAGGKAKQTNFAPLKPLLKKHARHLILIGDATEEMAALFEGDTPIHRAGSMEDAVTTAQRLAHRGETVLLSPACASFDMFRNFEDRGRRFCQAVEALTSLT